MSENETNKAFRVNARISQTTNQWLDEESQRIGISKGAIINLALDEYRNKKKSADTSKELLTLLKNMENLNGK